MDLLKRGANPNQKDKDGNSSLHYLFTIYNRNQPNMEKMAQSLLQYGADPNMKNNENWSPIHIVMKKGNIEALRFMIKYNESMKGTKKIFNLNEQGGHSL